MQGAMVGDLLPVAEVPENALACLRRGDVQIFAVRRSVEWWYRRWRWTFADGSHKWLWLPGQILPELYEDGATIIALDIPHEALPRDLEPLVNGWSGS